MIGFERGTDFREGLGLKAGQLGGHGGVGVHGLLKIVGARSAEHRLGNVQLGLHQLLPQRRGFLQGVGQNGEGFGLLVLVELETVGEDVERGLALHARHGAGFVSHPASASAARTAAHTAGVVAAHAAAALGERQSGGHHRG